MLDHVSLGVRILTRAIDFYDVVMQPLGVIRLWTTDSAAGYGLPGGDDRLALFQSESANPGGIGSHLAFTAATIQAVDDFHAIALARGGSDEGAPSLRKRYGPGYYAAFVRDADGHKLEAVCHTTSAGSTGPT